MNKRPISITLDPDMIDRIDRIADLHCATRTAVIERALIRSLSEQEDLIDSLSNPVARAAHSMLMSSPALLRIIAKIADEKLSDDDIRSLMEAAPRLREAGKQQQRKKKGSSHARKQTAPNARHATE